MPRKILTSIHGRKLGLDHEGNLLCPKGIITGDPEGPQFALGSPHHVVLFDDFVEGFRAGASQTWFPNEGTDSATSDAAIASTGEGGILRLTTGDAGTGYAADAEQITQRALTWKAINGGLTFEAKVRLSAITNCYAFLGFTDTVAAALEAPITASGVGNGLTSNATDAVGFMFDTRMTADNWWLTGVKGDTDATAQDTGIAPVATEWATLRIEVNPLGNAVFFINGIVAGTTMLNALTASASLTAIMAVSKTSVAASMTMDLDYVYVAMNR